MGEELDVIDTQPDTALSPTQRQAAYLDAQGVDRAVIAEAVGVSTKTISVWRGIPSYKTELEVWISRDLERLENLFATVKLETLDATRQAIKTLLEALKAEDSDGNELWSVRLDAAKALYAKVNIHAGDKGPVAEGSGATAQTAVIIVQRSGETYEVIEGTTT